MRQIIMYLLFRKDFLTDSQLQTESWSAVRGLEFPPFTSKFHHPIDRKTANEFYINLAEF